MAEKKAFGRGRKRGISFKPSGGRNRRPDRTSLRARANVETIQTPQDEIYDTRQHLSEIVRAENKAHGLPPDTDLESAKGQRQLTNEPVDGETPAQEESPQQDGQHPAEFVPVELPEEPAESVKEKVQRSAKKFVSKVKGVFRPIQHTHKEILINAESLETRVAITVKGKLENLTIERMDSLRMVGSIYKGRIRNLEDGLKAAFVDIGLEKNAFLHYWDIIPSPLDSSYDVVDRGKRKKEKPRITNKDIPRKYPSGTELTVEITKGPIGTKGPRVTTNVLLPGRYLVLLPNSEQSGVSRKIENREEAEQARVGEVVGRRQRHVIKSADARAFAGPMSNLVAMIVVAAVMAYAGWQVLMILEGMTLVSLPNVSVQLTQSIIPLGAVLFMIAEAVRLPELMRDARGGGFVDHEIREALGDISNTPLEQDDASVPSRAHAHRGER